MAGIVQEINNGKVVENTKTTETKKSNDVYDKDMFLQLLVAEMQYQDPLEPTSNTEYVTELASFTQIETVQTVADQMSNLEADSLVGKYVIMLHEGSEGKDYYSGKVDYAVNQDGKMYLSVNGTLYGIDELDSIVDEDYYIGVITAEEITEKLSKLPGKEYITVSDEAAIKEIRTLYDSLTSKQQNHVSAESVIALQDYEKKLAALKSAN